MTVDAGACEEYRPSPLQSGAAPRATAGGWPDRTWTRPSLQAAGSLSHREAQPDVWSHPPRHVRSRTGSGPSVRLHALRTERRSGTALHGTVRPASARAESRTGRRPGVSSGTATRTSTASAGRLSVLIARRGPRWLPVWTLVGSRETMDGAMSRRRGVGAESLRRGTRSLPASNDAPNWQPCRTSIAVVS
jgi:hypothetical protein